MREFFVMSVKKQLLLLAGFVTILFVPVSALHFDHDAFHFTTLDELLSTPGKEVKIWSDTLVRITGIGFKNRMDGNWQYQANKSIPCTLSVGDSIAVKFNASSIRSAENPVIDSLVIVVNQSLASAGHVQLHIGAFPHVLVTTNTITAPSLDTAGKNIQFGRDSVYCTLRHKMYYTFIWDDGFSSSWQDARTAVHSWSISRRYTVRVTARCQQNLFTDSSLSFPMTIAPSAINASAGAYKSGFFTQSGALRIDFSQGVNPPQDSDVVFGPHGGCLANASFGALNLGIFDSMPTINIAGYLNGFVPDTASVSRTYKPTYDSIVGSLHLICPAAMTDTCIAHTTKQVTMVKTKEGHSAILMKVGEFMGGMDRAYYYWGYQSDGGRMFAPAASSGLDNKLIYKKSNTPAAIKIIKRGEKIQLVLPGYRPIKEISVYGCNGSLLHHAFVKTVKVNSIELGTLPKGLYIVAVSTDEGKMNQRLYIYY
jgi:hypothetical protein